MSYDVTSAPGGPISAAVDYSQYQQQQQQQQSQPQYDQSNAYTSASYGYPASQHHHQVDPNQSVMPTAAPDYSTSVPVDYPSQSFGPVVEQQNNQYIPGLPPGAKIVAEYFLGYLDEPAQQQYIDQNHQVVAHQVSHQMSQQMSQPVYPGSQQFQFQQQTQPHSSSERCVYFT